MKRIRLIIYLAVVILGGLLAAGCQKENKTPGITAVTPTQMTAIEPTKGGRITDNNTQSPGPGGNEAGISAAPTGQENANDPDSHARISPTPDTGVTQVPAPTGEGSTAGRPDENTDDTRTGPTGSENTIPDDADDNDDAPDDDNEETAEYWEGSFLVWLPRFKKGSFAGFDSDETHDYITLENVSGKSVRKYIKTLTQQGFSLNTGYSDAEGNPLPDAADAENTRFLYHALNEDDWCARLDYDPDTGILIIGSGYEQNETTDVYGRLREETALGLIPEFTYGEFDSSKQEGGMYYVVFSNVSGKYGKYVDQLKKAGFTEEADEGDVDGIIWYNAVNADGYACEFIYSDGVARIGCGEPEQ